MWYPASEAEATSMMAALVEWLRASQPAGAPAWDPARVEAWNAADPKAIEAVLAAFQPAADETGAMRALRRAALFEEWGRIRQRS